MQTRLPIISPEECTRLYGAINALNVFRYICTLDITKRRGSGNGDRGGPLVYNRRLLGVLYQRSLNLGVRPDVFINMKQPFQHQWINEKMHQLRQ